MTTDTNKKHFFDTKEDYLNFKKQWASAVNDKRAKKELIKKSYTHYGNEVDCSYQKKGWVQAVHHVIYNIVRDKPFDYGFTAITDKNKLQNNFGNPTHAFDSALYMLGVFQRSAKDSRRVHDVMEPFGDSISLSKLKSFDLKQHR